MDLSVLHSSISGASAVNSVSWSRELARWWPIATRGSRELVLLENRYVGSIWRIWNGMLCRYTSVKSSEMNLYLVEVEGWWMLWPGSASGGIVSLRQTMRGCSAGVWWKKTSLHTLYNLAQTKKVEDQTVYITSCCFDLQREQVDIANGDVITWWNAKFCIARTGRVKLPYGTVTVVKAFCFDIGRRDRRYGMDEFLCLRQIMREHAMSVSKLLVWFGKGDCFIDL